jgi:nucleoside-diphosphate-sugar epimerase
VSQHIFITGGSGFIGSIVVRRAIEAGHRVQVLTRSEKSAAKVRSAGAEPIIGDINQSGAWQETAAQADVVYHLAQPETYGTKITKKHAEAFREQRLKMDAALLDCLRPDVVKRIIYVAGTSYYGNQGSEMVNEDTTPNPKGWGPYIAPAIDKLQDYIASGLPIITAFPSWVYGLGSWFTEYTLKPIYSRKVLFNLRRQHDPVISVVHVEDVGRGLIHLLDHGEIGKRYFITDDQPLSGRDVATIAAKVLDAPMNVQRFPMFLVRWYVGPIIVDSMNTEAKLSNARIKQTGFKFVYPTAEQGIPQVIDQWLKQRTAT